MVTIAAVVTSDVTDPQFRIRPEPDPNLLSNQDPAGTGFFKEDPAGSGTESVFQIKIQFWIRPDPDLKNRSESGPILFKNKIRIRPDPV